MLDKVVLDKLATVEQRSEELELQMADPEVAGEYSRLEGVIKEHSSLRHIVALFREYRGIDRRVGGGAEPDTRGERPADGRARP